ncbi:MAG TPA: hypothetical protein VF482_13605 [Trebonia sp.]
MRAACPRRFILLAERGVRVRWMCGAHQDFPDETAVDVDVLRDRLGDIPHHHHHHVHREVRH